MIAVKRYFDGRIAAFPRRKCIDKITIGQLSSKVNDLIDNLKDITEMFEKVTDYSSNVNAKLSTATAELSTVREELHALKLQQTKKHEDEAAMFTPKKRVTNVSAESGP